MTPETVFLCVVAATGIGIAFGFAFVFFAADSREKVLRDLWVGVIGAYLGLILGLVLPIRAPDKAVGAEAFAAGVSIYALLVYWWVFRERTNIARHFDEENRLLPEKKGVRRHPHRRRRRFAFRG